MCFLKIEALKISCIGSNDKLYLGKIKNTENNAIVKK